MRLVEALKYVYSSHRTLEELTNPFILFSNLSDLCNDSFIAKEEVKDYWKVISKVNIYKHILENDDPDIKTKLMKLYSQFGEYFSIDLYKKMIDYTISSVPKLVTKTETKKVIKKDRRLFGFTIKDNVLVKYKGKKKKVIIPEEVEVIDAYAFDNLPNLKEIVIPSTVKLIKTFAFNNLYDLQLIVVGNVEMIEEYSFWNCRGSIYCELEKKPPLWSKRWNSSMPGFIFDKKLKTYYGK